YGRGSSDSTLPDEEYLQAAHALPIHDMKGLVIKEPRTKLSLRFLKFGSRWSKFDCSLKIGGVNRSERTL
ncbi:5858_t:CDS:1, partial [Paraglomus occultum]